MPGSLHIHNARIWTGDANRPWVSAITARGEVISSLDGQTPSSGKDRRVIDARGRVIVPGLIDSHMHLLMGAKSLGEVDLSRVSSRREFEDVIATARAQLPPDRWLICRGWSEQNWPGHQMPDKTWLRGCRDRPCVCHRMDIHAALVNEPVLAMIGADNRADPQGGRIVRGAATGEPTGLMLEAAAWELVNPLIPDLDFAAKRECLLAAQAHAHRLGLTGVGSMEFADDVENVFRLLREQLTLRCAITLLDRGWPMSFDYGRNFPNDNHLAVIGYKAFIDGTLGSRTARMLDDYSDDPGNRGMLVELAASGHLNEWAEAVARQGLSPAMHAIGDEAVRMALCAASAAQRANKSAGRAGQPRIEHVQHLDRSDLPLWNRRIASMQPLHKADDGRYIVQRLGAERAQRAFAFRDLHDAGATLAFGSDWPVVSCDPVLGMRAAITGLTLDEQPFATEQNLTIEQALTAYTAGAASALNMHYAGMLGVGRLADCVMFDIDPFTADWVRQPPHVVMTIVRGEVVFDGTKD